LIIIDDNLPNAKDKLTKVSSSVSTTEYTSFDILGRVLGHKQTTDGQDYITAYAYNLSGAMVEQVYPSGRVVRNVLDGNGDLAMVDRRIGSDLQSCNIVEDRVRFCGMAKTGYDALIRVTQRSYSDSTPAVSYFYDNLTNAKGRLTKVESSISTTEYTEFDILGRVKAHKQTTDGQSYTTGYNYNLSGALIEQTYPSGRVVKNVLDGNGDLSIVQSKKNEDSGYWDYAKHFTYNPAGAVTSLQLGNGQWQSNQFNSRMQMTAAYLGSIQNTSNLLKLDFNYGTSQNNGNLLSQTITVPTVGIEQGFTATQNYAYDSLNRLKSANESISSTETWKQTFIFDRYGNRNFDEANTTTLPKDRNGNTEVCDAIRPIVNPSVNTANNRLNGYTFDASGNTTVDAEGRIFVYDAENKQTEVRDSQNTIIGQYHYDGDGKRVKKIVPATGEVTIFVYAAGAKLIAEYSTVVESVEHAKVAYLNADHLGSPRINTDANGNIVSRSDYMPYGEEIITLGGRTANNGYLADDVRQGFTGYENDEETSLDFAQARMYVKSLGRFSGADSLYIEQNRIFSPQQFNLYAYAANNPIRFVDPSGLAIEVTGDAVDDYMRRLNNLTPSFIVRRNQETNKVEIVDSEGNVLDKKALKTLGKSLKDSKEKELFKAITDTKNTARIEAVNDDPDTFFGRFMGNGRNIVDEADLQVLDNSSDNGGITSAQVVGHETLEAYHSAINRTSLANMGTSHVYANQFFPGLMQAANPNVVLTINNGNITHIQSNFSVQDKTSNATSTTLRIERQFVTPIPLNAIPSTGAPIPQHVVDVRRIP
jgi:RHS repeat-associated protein